MGAPQMICVCGHHAPQHGSITIGTVRKYGSCPHCECEKFKRIAAGFWIDHRRPEPNACCRACGNYVLVTATYEHVCLDIHEGSPVIVTLDDGSEVEDVARTGIVTVCGSKVIYLTHLHHGAAYLASRIRHKNTPMSADNHSYSNTVGGLK